MILSNAGTVAYNTIYRYYGVWKIDLYVYRNTIMSNIYVVLRIYRISVLEVQNNLQQYQNTR